MHSESQQKALFPVLSEEQIACMRAHATEETWATGDILFAEGEIADKVYVLLEGEIKVTRRIADSEILLTIHHPGQFTGEIAALSGGKSIATGRATMPSRVLALNPEGLRRVLISCAGLAEIVVTAMAKRRPEADVLLQQREKLESLGMMSAGIAHELNNPAAAASRSASQLRASFQAQRSVTVALCRSTLTAEQLHRLIDLAQEASERLGQEPELDPLARSDREDALCNWMEDYSVAEPWDLAPTFVDAGLGVEQLEALRADLGEDSLEKALQWLNATLNIDELLREVEQSATRISELVQAIKQYSYMDQAPIQEVDVHEGLENTLTLLNHRLRKTSIVVHRDYDRTVPCLTAYGSELTQVWTNLLVNAIEALGDKGNIWIRTACEGDAVLVEIADDGPGIASDALPHVFEPFFTTKGVGEGTGMGLNISYRIIVERHHGDIRVFSKPGKTSFQTRLPINLTPTPLLVKERGEPMPS